MIETNYSIIIGIDFGTAYSGYSFRRKGGEEAYFSPYFQNLYSDVKLPTVVLFNENKEPIHWGNEALKKYAETNDSNAILLQYFKLDMLELAKINNDERPHKVYQTKSGRNVEIDLIHATSYIFKEIKNNAEDFCRSNDVIVSQNTIRWVITVPGNASDIYVRWMRMAAKEAEIIKNIDDNNLLIGREPEVATLYAIYMDKQNSKGIEINKKGNKLLILDCGGGTVDIGAYEIEESRPLKMKPLDHARAKNCGGALLNEKFEYNILGREFGRAADDNANEQQMITAGKGLIMNMKSKKGVGEAWNKTLYEWENIQKREFGGNEIIPFSFPAAVLKYLQNEQYSIYQGLIQNEIVDDELYEPWKIEPEMITDKVFNDLMTTIKEELYKVIIKVNSDFDTLIFVGGFSQSPYLRKYIKQEFQNKIHHFIEPPRSSCAVVWGASAFGDNPDMLIGRILSCGYAVDVGVEYGKNTKDYNYKRVRIDNKDYCLEHIDICLKKGELCKSGEELFLKSYRPIRESSKVIKFNIYTIDNEDAEYTDDDGVSLLGSFEINLSEPGGLANLYCSFINNSELCFIARNGNGDEKQSDTLVCNWKWKE